MNINLLCYNSYRLGSQASYHFDRLNLNALPIWNKYPIIRTTNYNYKTTNKWFIKLYFVTVESENGGKTKGVGKNFQKFYLGSPGGLRHPKNFKNQEKNFRFLRVPLSRSQILPWHWHRYIGKLGIHNYIRHYGRRLIVFASRQVNFVYFLRGKYSKSKNYSSYGSSCEIWFSKTVNRNYVIFST